MWDEGRGKSRDMLIFSLPSLCPHPSNVFSLRALPHLAWLPRAQTRACILDVLSSFTPASFENTCDPGAAGRHALPGLWLRNFHGVCRRCGGSGLNRVSRDRDCTFAIGRSWQGASSIAQTGNALRVAF